MIQFRRRPSLRVGHPSWLKCQTTLSSIVVWDPFRHEEGVNRWGERNGRVGGSKCNYGENQMGWTLHGSGTRGENWIKKVGPKIKLLSHQRDRDVSLGKLSSTDWNERRTSFDNFLAAGYAVFCCVITYNLQHILETRDRICKFNICIPNTSETMY